MSRSSHAFIDCLAGLEEANSRRLVAGIRQAAAASRSASEMLSRPPVMEAIQLAPQGTFDDNRYHKEECYALASYCFALHKQQYRKEDPPGMCSGRSFGDSLGTLKVRLGDKGGGPSLDLRFNALIDCPFEDVFHHLPHLVQRVAHHDTRIGIDHARLLQHLLRWNRESRSVQRIWSRDYWRHQTANTETVTQ